MEQPPPIPTTSPVAPSMPLWARLLNVFAVPGEVFEHVRISRVAVGNWLAPMVLGGLVASVSAWIIASQPALQQQIREQQGKNIEAQVQAGKISREDANRMMALMEKIFSPTALKFFGVTGGIVTGIVRVLGWGLALWFLGQTFLKVRIPFWKAAEVAGLASLIAVLGTVVTLLLQVNFSNPSSSPSLALTVDFDARNPMHLILAALNLFDFWHLFVLAAGLGRLAGVPFLRTSFVIISFWLIWMTVMLALSAFTRGFMG